MSSTAQIFPAPPPRDVAELVRDARTLRCIGGSGLAWILLLLRLPQIMTPLGVLTWVAVGTGSAWCAAMSAAAMYVGSALCGLLMMAFSGVIWRQWGLLVLSVAHGVAMWLLPGVSLELMRSNAQSGGTFLPFLAAGLALTPMGLACRIRWSSILRQTRRMDLFPTAMRQESISEAMAVLVGATFTGVVALALGAQVTLRFSAVLTVVATVVFLAHPSARIKQFPATAPLWGGVDRAVQARRYSARRLRRQLTLGCAGLGALLGAIQGCLLVYAVSLDSVPSLSALYASLGLTTAVTAMIVLLLLPRYRPWNLRVISSTAALLASMMLSVPGGGLGFSVVLGLMGLCIGPSLVSSFALVSFVAPGELFMGLTARVTSALIAGTALGLALSAYYGTHYGYISAALVPVAMAMFHMGYALIFVYTWRRSTLSRSQAIQ